MARQVLKSGYIAELYQVNPEYIMVLSGLIIALNLLTLE